MRLPLWIFFSGSCKSSNRLSYLPTCHAVGLVFIQKIRFFPKKYFESFSPLGRLTQDEVQGIDNLGIGGGDGFSHPAGPGRQRFRRRRLRGRRSPAVPGLASSLLWALLSRLL